MLRFTLLVIVVIVGGIWHAACASAADVSHETTTVPFSFVQPATECTGEDVEVSGELHAVTTVVEDSNGATHVVVVLTAANVVGTGTTSGAVYHGGEGSHSSFLSTGSQNEITANFRLVLSSGSGATLVLHGIFHETVDANGDVRADVAFDHAGCGG